MILLSTASYEDKRKMKKETLELLKKYHQEHLLDYLSLLNEEEQKILENQILSLDFENLNKLYETTKKEIQIEEKQITHIPYIDKEKLSKEKTEELQEIASNIISSGKYAVVTMAGGQGTRLRTLRTKRKLCLRYNLWYKIFI